MGYLRVRQSAQDLPIAKKRFERQQMSKIGYYIKDHGQTIEDVTYFDENAIVDLEDPIDIEGFVCDAAQWAWDYNDGWEWLNGGAMFSMVVDDEGIGDFNVYVDFDPSFSSSKVKDND